MTRNPKILDDPEQVRQRQALADYEAAVNAHWVAPDAIQKAVPNLTRWHQLTVSSMINQFMITPDLPADHLEFLHGVLRKDMLRFVPELTADQIAALLKIDPRQLPDWRTLNYQAFKAKYLKELPL